MSGGSEQYDRPVHLLRPSRLSYGSYQLWSARNPHGTGDIVSEAPRQDTQCTAGSGTGERLPHHTCTEG